MKMIHLVVAGAAGVGLYLLWKRMPQQGNLSESPYSNPSYGQNLQYTAQPSLMYPIRPIVPPRVDNTSQPWYGGSRAFNLNSPDSFLGSDFQRVVSDFNGLASISESLSSISQSLGIDSWFSDDDAYGGSFGVESYGVSWQSDLAYA